MPSGLLSWSQHIHTFYSRGSSLSTRAANVDSRNFLRADASIGGPWGTGGARALPPPQKKNIFTGFGGGGHGPANFGQDS